MTNVAFLYNGLLAILNFIFSIFINYKFLQKVILKQVAVLNHIHYQLHSDTKFDKLRTLRKIFHLLILYKKYFELMPYFVNPCTIISPLIPYSLF